MGKDFVTVDFSGLLTEDEIAEAEKMANTVVFADERILAEYPGKKELEKLEYRSKKELDGDIRIVYSTRSGCMCLLRNTCEAHR